MREGFGRFRVDRIEALEVPDVHFRDPPGSTLVDLFGQAGADRAGCRASSVSSAARGGVWRKRWLRRDVPPLPQSAR